MKTANIWSALKPDWRKVYGGIGDYLSAEINKRYTEFQTRVTRLGHVQRAGARLLLTALWLLSLALKQLNCLTKAKLTAWLSGKTVKFLLQRLKKSCAKAQPC